MSTADVQYLLLGEKDWEENPHSGAESDASPYKQGTNPFDSKEISYYSNIVCMGVKLGLSH
jgi:hypothetical protein